MRVVVLDPRQVHPVQVEGVLGGQVLRVQVVGHHLGLDAEQPAVVPDPLGEGAQRLGVLQVPDVVGQEGPVPLGQAERVLQLGPAGQHRAPERDPHRDRLRYVPAGPPEHHFPATERSCHRVIRPDVDGPVMGQEGVRDPAQPPVRVLVPVRDRLVGNVAAGQDDGAAHRAEQQMVQRRVRQHEPQLPVPRRHRLRHGGPRAPRFRRWPAARCARRLVPAAVVQAWQQHDRPPHAAQHARRRLVHLAQFPRPGQVRDHHRERLVLAVLAFPQRRRGLLRRRGHGQVIAAQPLDRQDVPVPQQRGRDGHRVTVRRIRARAGQGQRRPARRAAGRLGVEAPVSRVAVLGRARRAHREPGHRGPGPVVRDVPDDREPRPAVRAVDERVAEPPVGRVGQLAQAVRAGRGVRRHQGLPRAPGRAGHDRKARAAVRCHRPGPDPVDPGQRRRVPLQPAQELADRLARPLDLGENPVGVVADEAAQAQRGRQRVHERAETDPLDDPLHPDGRPDPFSHHPSVAGCLVRFQCDHRPARGPPPGAGRPARRHLLLNRVGRHPGGRPRSRRESPGADLNRSERPRFAPGRMGRHGFVRHDDDLRGGP